MMTLILHSHQNLSCLKLLSDFICNDTVEEYKLAPLLRRCAPLAYVASRFHSLVDFFCCKILFYILALINYTCAKSPIGCSDFDHMYTVRYMIKDSERIFIWYLIGCSGWCRRFQAGSRH